MAENGKAVLTYRIVIIVVVCVGTAFGVLSYIKTDFKEDFFPNLSGVRLEEKVSGIDRSLSIIQASSEKISDSQAVLAKELVVLQQRELALAEAMKSIQAEMANQNKK